MQIKEIRATSTKTGDIQGHKSGRLGLTLLLMMGLSLSAVAEPKVLYDSGETQSIEPYVPIVEKRDPKDIDINAYQRQIEQAAQKNPRQPNLFPLKSQRLRLGRERSRKINRPDIKQPFFIIGADKESMAWMSKNINHLKERNAYGVVVQARNQNDIEIIRKTADGLAIYPMDIGVYANELGIRHYPVFVSKEEIIQ